MNTVIFNLPENGKIKDELRKAAAVLEKGGLVVFPTETVYGLGGDATNAEAAQKIYAAKGRPSDNPLIIHVANPEDAESYAHTSPAYYRLAKAFMPGPLTVILPKKDVIPYSVTGGLDTVAVRCPSDPIAHELISTFGKPIAAPSANLSGKPSPTRAEHVIHDLGGRVDMILAGAPCDIGLESTIVKLDGDSAVLLRPGAITFDALSCVLEHVTIADAVIGQLKENERPMSPGMKYKHYAPSAPMTLLYGDEQRFIAFCRKAIAENNATVLCYDEELPMLGAEHCIPIGSKDDTAAQAHLIFAALRKADQINATLLYTHLPPKTGMGLALYNRLIRAAAHTIQKL